MLFCLDLGLCVVAVLLAYSLRTGEWRIFRPFVLKLIAMTCIAWTLVAPAQGVYRSMLRFSDRDSIKDLAISCGLLAAILILPLIVLRMFAHAPRTLAVLVPLVLFVMLAGARITLSALLRDILYSRRRSGQRCVLIYGAGVAGRELGLSINDDPEFDVVGYVDDDRVLRGRRIGGRKIWHSSELEQALTIHSVHEVLLAIPRASRARRREIVEEIQEIAPGVAVRSLPNIAEIASGRISVGDLRELQIEELLGRDQVEPNEQLMSANIRGRCVMVTGAGGSIGSELCRQIVQHDPSRIILAERSELALYTINEELTDALRRRRSAVIVLPKLVDVSDEADIERIFREFRPDTVFHAAAYKHVPLVEADPIAGIRNNVLGTYNCCKLAAKYGVSTVTLVSTDKAVRPTSVMGASKRICELVVQSWAATKHATTYSAVRFGNVLGSSGSVVPLFRRQIERGGPITITHRDATRYFMTVPEAAQLVVQAGAMAKGGEIFLLEMGEPVRIGDLARLMIKLSGLGPVDENGDGDIAIEEIGLRPGEKVHEELLIDNRAVATSHPRIVMAIESGPVARFDAKFPELLRHMDTRDSSAALAIINELVACQGARAGPVKARAKADKTIPPKARRPRAVKPMPTRRAFEA